MLIVCPTCTTAYKISLAALGGAGRSVRCSQCKNTWFATPESVVEEAVTVPAIVPARASAAAKAPPQDDFDASGSFSVESEQPADPAAAAEAERILAETDSPPLAPSDGADPHEPSASKFDPGTPDEIETPAARRARKTSASRGPKLTIRQRILSAPALIAVLLVVIVTVIQARSTVVRHFPQTGSLFAAIGMPVNLRGLVFKDVVSKSEFHEGATVLVVEGTVANLTPKALDVPRLRFSLRNASGHEVYAWTALPTRPQLGSGDGLAFRTRLASPPADGRDVIVRFFNRRDAALGTP